MLGLISELVVLLKHVSSNTSSLPKEVENPESAHCKLFHLQALSFFLGLILLSISVAKDISIFRHFRGRLWGGFKDSKTLRSFEESKSEEVFLYRVSC